MTLGKTLLIVVFTFALSSTFLFAAEKVPANFEAVSTVLDAVWGMRMFDFITQQKENLASVRCGRGVLTPTPELQQAIQFCLGVDGDASCKGLCLFKGLGIISSGWIYQSEIAAGHIRKIFPQEEVEDVRRAMEICAGRLRKGDGSCQGSVQFLECLQATLAQICEIPPVAKIGLGMESGDKEHI